MEREGGDTSSFPVMENKDALIRYVQLFPDVVRAIRDRRVRDGSASRGEEDAKLVGFGAHAGVTYRDLYDSTDKERKR